MKPSKKHHYRVKDLVFENVIVVVLKFVNSFLSDVCIKKLKCLNHSFYEMVTDVCRLRTIDFSKLCNPRIGYSDQQEIQSSRVDLATAGIIYYSLHPGMLTGIRLWAQICAHLILELRKCLITFLLFVRCLRLIARNDREIFSFNRGVSHLNNACRIDDVSRGSLLCYEILTNN
jgi:hypothetical protein